MVMLRPHLHEYKTQAEWEAAMEKWLEAQMVEDQLEVDEDTEDRYDRFGNVSENGIYDAGGHLIEDWYDRIDEDAGRDR